MSTALRTYYRGQNLVAMRDEVAGQNLEMTAAARPKRAFALGG
jgi:hypothetical protein